MINDLYSVRVCKTRGDLFCRQNSMYDMPQVGKNCPTLSRNIPPPRLKILASLQTLVLLAIAARGSKNRFDVSFYYGPFYY